MILSVTANKGKAHCTVCRQVVKIKFDFRLWILNFMFYICHKRSAPSYRKEKSQKSLLLFEIFQGLYTQKINEKKTFGSEKQSFRPIKKKIIDYLPLC